MKLARALTKWKSTSLLFGSATLLFAIAPAAWGVTPSDTLWSYAAPAKVGGTALDAAGNLVVSMDSLIVALEPDSGRLVWTHAVTGKTCVFRTVLGSYFLVGHGRTLAAFDAATGKMVWHRTDLLDLEHASVSTSRDDRYALIQSENDFAVLDLETGTTRWNSRALPAGTIVREYFRIADQNLLLLLARTPKSEASMLAVTLDSARVLWHNDAFFRTLPKVKREGGVEYLFGYQYAAFPDTTLLLYLSEDGPMRIDPRTGSVRWQAAALAGVPVPGWATHYPTARLLDSLVVIPSEKHLVALDAATGQVRWRTAREFRDRPTWLVARSAGILVGGVGREKPFLTAIDSKTGTPAWPRPIDLEVTATGVLKSDTLFVSDHGRLSAIPLTTGIPRLLSTIEFKGGEQPTHIDTLESGALVLFSRQNIARIEPDGRVGYRRFYKAPGASFWAKLATSALLLGANLASYGLTPAGGTAPIITSNPVLSARYGRASQAENFFYIFTASADSLDQNGFSLVRVDRRDGRELGRMWFEERSPDYRLDPVTGSVYALKDHTRIVARRFQGGGAETQRDAAH